MAQISFSFSGGFWPISFPLFHGTTRPSALGAVLVAACMNGSLIGGKEPHVDPGPRALVDPGRPVRSPPNDRLNLPAVYSSEESEWTRNRKAVDAKAARIRAESRLPTGSSEFSEGKNAVFSHIDALYVAHRYLRIRD